MSEDTDSAGAARILVVEDNLADARLIREGAESVEKDVEPELMRTGREAIDWLTTDGSESETDRSPPWVPGLVFLDLNLPGASGFDILDEVRSSDRLETVPVVIVSSSQNPEDVARAYENAANAYLTKPTDPDDYIEMIAAAIDLWIPDPPTPTDD